LKILVKSFFLLHIVLIKTPKKVIQALGQASRPTESL
jgi:hypothetical protein